MELNTICEKGRKAVHIDHLADIGVQRRNNKWADREHFGGVQSKYGGCPQKYIICHC